MKILKMIINKILKCNKIRINLIKMRIKMKMIHIKMKNLKMQIQNKTCKIINKQNNNKNYKNQNIVIKIITNHQSKNKKIKIINS